MLIQTCALTLFPSILAQLDDGRLPVTAQDLPTFLYENGVVDLTEINKGLCRGHLLVRVSDIDLMYALKH